MPAFCAAKRRTLGKEKLKGGKGERKKEGERGKDFGLNSLYPLWD